MELKIKPTAGSPITFNYKDKELEIHIGLKNDLYYAWLNKKQRKQLLDYLNKIEDTDTSHLNV